MKHFTRSLSVLALLGIASAAHADLFNFSYTLPTDNGSLTATGQFTTSALDPNTSAYTILGITGTRTYEGVTANITGLIAPGGFEGNNNLLYTTSPYVDLSGFSYTIDANNPANDTNNVNFYYSATNSAYTETGAPVGYSVNFTVTPVPAPNSLAVFASMAGLGGVMLRRRKK